MSDLQAQLESYADIKRKEFAARSSLTAMEARVHSQENERTALLQRNNTGPTESWTCWAVITYCRDIMYTIFSSDLEVLRLPMTDKWLPVRIHFLWLIFTVASAIPAFSTSFLLGVYTLVMMGPVLFLTVLTHEMGHIIAALMLGGEVETVLLWPLGGLGAVSLTGEINIVTDVLISIAGPLMHIPQLAFWAICMYLTNHGQVALITPLDWGTDFWLSVCSGAMTMQFALFIFNMLPAYPLDGGHLLKALLTHFNLLASTVARATAFVGSLFAWYFVFGGLQGGGPGVDYSSSWLLQLVSGGNEFCVGAYMLYECYGLWRDGAMMAYEEGADASTQTSPTSAAAPSAHSGAHGVHTVYTLASVPSTGAPGPYNAAETGRSQGGGGGGGGGSGMHGAGRKLGSATGVDYESSAV